MARCEDRIVLPHAEVVAHVREDDGGTRMHDVAGGASGRRRALSHHRRRRGQEDARRWTGLRALALKHQPFRPGRRRLETPNLGPFSYCQRMLVRSFLRAGSRQLKAPSMASLFKPRSRPTAKKATGSKSTGSCARLRAHKQATLSPSRLRRRQRTQNPPSRQICARRSRPPPRRRERCGRTSRATRAEIGSTGSPPRSSQKRARAGSKMPARCSLPGSGACAASIAPGSTVRA